MHDDPFAGIEPTLKAHKKLRAAKVAQGKLEAKHNQLSNIALALERLEHRRAEIDQNKATLTDTANKIEADEEFDNSCDGPYQRAMNFAIRQGR
jgi:hypothetical protein